MAARGRSSRARAACCLLLVLLQLSARLRPAGAGAAAPQRRRSFPWEVSRDEKLPWEGLHNDLDALLKVQARDNAVSVLVFNEGFALVTLNCLVSMIAFANLENIIVTAAGAGSLGRCTELRLPCYDSAHLIAAYGSKAAEGDATRNSPEWFQLVWVKTLIAHAIIKRDYNVLFTDADTVYLKDATSAYASILRRYDADGSFMFEEANQTREDGTPYLNRYLNSGNFFLMSNPRTKKMMAMWAIGYKFQSNSNGNQLWLNKLEALGYRLCHSREQCGRHRAAGWAAIKPHPNQYEGLGQMCTPHKLPGGVCGDRRLYVHAVCRAGHHLKKQAFEKLGLWFVHPDAAAPGGVRVELPPGLPLPCSGATWELGYPGTR
ncbi:MAG: nucleotide-diphospho-sugar transferase-domain-containing protein [Monoraphidium minutum]|nr:MAG: nucleotide-diphospho-sugar transferase-domain-containing protein [Monoraphidium minutum]